VRSGALYIVQRLRFRGHEAYWVGGCVRDLLRGDRPQDYDITTSARPEEITSIFRHTIPVGAKFGVVIVRLRHKNYEVATFRAESGYQNGRHPDRVWFSTARQDVKRRDFTINGILYDPVREKVIDYVGGQKDLERKVIRAIGNPERRFCEDKLRMIRAVRFAARFNYHIESRTEKAIQRHASEIMETSAERIRDELAYILTGPNPGPGIRILDQLGLLEHVLPEVSAMKGVPQPAQFHPEGDVFQHTILMLDQLKSPSLVLALGVLLHDVGKPETFSVSDRIRFNQHQAVGAEMTRKIMRRLRFSSEQIRRVSALVDQHLRFIDVFRMKESTLKRFLRIEDFPLHLELHRLDCLASHGDLSAWRYCRRKYNEYSRKHAEEKLRPRPLLTGHDLIQLGLKPGPIFKKILSEIEDAQLEGKIKTKEQAIKLAKTHTRKYLNNPNL
jgi:poly(A) polymerase